MTTVNVTTPLPKCPNQQLIRSEVTYSGQLYSDQTACLGGKELYNDADIRKKCPYSKTHEQCADGIRSEFILNSLTSQNIGACGNLEVLADELKFCSRGMESVTRSVIQNSSSPKDAQTTAKLIRQTCNFK